MKYIFFNCSLYQAFGVFRLGCLNYLLRSSFFHNFPSYITSTRSQKDWTRARLWQIKRRDKLRSFRIMILLQLQGFPPRRSGSSRRAFRLLWQSFPTSGLDYHRMLEVSAMIQKAKKENRVILIVSYDFEFLGRICDKIFDMEKFQEGARSDGGAV